MVILNPPPHFALPDSEKHAGTLHATVERKVVQFHEDLFPPTASNKPVLEAAQYFGGADAMPFLLTPDPAHALFARATNIVLTTEVRRVWDVLSIVVHFSATRTTNLKNAR